MQVPQVSYEEIVNKLAQREPLLLQVVVQELQIEKLTAEPAQEAEPDG